jgi:vacuolar-type H+-ATPase subunit B/Vma2
MALYYIYAYLALSFFLFRRLIVQKYKTHKREHYVLKMDLFLSQVKIWGGTHSVGPVKEMFSVCGQLMAVHLSQNMRLRCYFVQVVLKKLH